MYKNTKNWVGDMGQAEVLCRLRKLGIKSYEIGIHNMRGVSDIVIEGGEFIEVKCSVYKVDLKLEDKNKKSLQKAGWGFAAIKRSEGKYLAFVLLEEDLTVYKVIYCLRKEMHSDQWKYLRPDKRNRLGTKGIPTCETKLKDGFTTNFLEIYNG